MFFLADKFEAAKKSLKFYSTIDYVDKSFEVIINQVKFKSVNNLKYSKLKNSSILIILLFGLTYYENSKMIIEILSSNIKSLDYYLNLASFLMSVLNLIFINTCNRKVLLLTSNIGLSVSIIGMGISVNSQFFTFGLTCCIAYHVNYYCSILILLTILGDLLPMNLKINTIFSIIIAKSSITFYYYVFCSTVLNNNSIDNLILDFNKIENWSIIQGFLISVFSFLIYCIMPITEET